MENETQMTADEIRAQIEKILADCEVTFGAIYMGETRNAFGEKNSHPMDKWSVSFTVRDGRAAHEEFEFFTGLGHRAQPTAQEKSKARFSVPGLTQNDITRRTLYSRLYFAELENLRKPKAPHPADVLYSLIRDEDATEQSFESWCSDLGYDTDSRKAFGTYMACQKNSDKLTRVFDATARRAIADALQDY